MLLQLRPGGQSADLLDFEWSKPLARWNDPRLVRMARGASRHIVRFVETGGRVYALKEIGDRVAHREYSMLREMLAAELPVVEPVGTVT